MGSCNAWNYSVVLELIFHGYHSQNFISAGIVVILGFCGAVSVEKLNWKLVKLWIPVNLIFIGMLVSGMYRYVEMPTLWCIFLLQAGNFTYVGYKNYKLYVIEFVLFTLKHQYLLWIFQPEIYKYCNGDNSEEYDKYFNSNWRILSIP